MLEVDSKKELGVSSFVYKNLETRAQGGGTRHIFFSTLNVCETVVDYLERGTYNTPCVNKMVGAENLLECAFQCDLPFTGPKNWEIPRNHCVLNMRRIPSY